jgi:hypothetical protein
VSVKVKFKATVVLITLVLATGWMVSKEIPQTLLRGDKTPLRLSVSHQDIEDGAFLFVQVWFNETNLVYEQQTSRNPWNHAIDVPPGTRVEVKGFVYGRSWNAECIIFDDNGNTYDAQSERFPGHDKPVVCEASIL